MSINIGSVSSFNGQTNNDGNDVQRRQAMKDLFSAIKSGNIQDAQQAYAALTKGQTPPANSPLGKLGAALQSGDMTAVTSTLKSLRAGHHHQRLGGSVNASTNASTTTAAPNTLPGQGTNLNVMA